MTKVFHIEELDLLIKTQEVINKVYPSAEIKISTLSKSNKSEYIVVFFEYQEPCILFVFAQEYEMLKYYKKISTSMTS